MFHGSMGVISKTETDCVLLNTRENSLCVNNSMRDYITGNIKLNDKEMKQFKTNVKRPIMT